MTRGGNIEDGTSVNYEKYNIGGGNFFRLRELGAALGFKADFDTASNTSILRSTQD